MGEFKETSSSNKLQEDIIYTEIKNPYGFIYITTNLVDGKRYLGQRKFYNNWQDYVGSGIAFKQALSKYGKENFIKRIIDVAYSPNELNKKEYDYSVFFDVVESDDWYNLVLGGGINNGWHPSEETKKKMSASNKGKKVSEETKEKLREKAKEQFQSIEARQRMSDLRKGKCLSAETKKKLSDIKKGRPPNNKGKPLSVDAKKKISDALKGRLVSIETRSKISAAKKGECTGVNSSRYRPVYCLELDQCFWGAKDVQNKYPDISSDGVSKACAKKQNTCGRHPITGVKLHWAYAETAIRENYITQEQLDNYLNCCANATK